LKVIHVFDIDVKQNLEGVIAWLREHEAFQAGCFVGTPPEEGNWEAASELLARIQAEKAQLIKDKKIKKQKPLPPISEDEKPFELPDGWVWCRLGEITINSLGKMLDAQKNKGELKPYLRNLNVQWFKVNISDLKLMPFEEHETQKYSVIKGDIVICEGGYPGQAAIWEKEEPIMFQKALHRVRFIAECFPPKLFVHILWLWDANGEIRQHYTGAGIQHLTGKSLNKILIPLPPLQEQKAIATKVEKLLAVCDQLETQITDKQHHAEQLMQAVLKEAFSQA
jgi:type I restriction enzyme S subunit